MATRWYFSSSGAPTVSPSFDAAWGDVADAVRRPMNKTRTGTVPATIAGSGTSGGELNTLLVQFVSSPLASQVISGTIKGQLLVRELDGATDARSQVVARVVSDGGTVRGTLLAAHAEALSSEWQTSVFTNRKAPLAALSPATMTAVVAQEGDRLVIEIGARVGDNSVDQIGVRIFDNAASDLPEDEAATGDSANPWIELSGPILTASEVGRGAGLGVGIGVGL